MLLTRENSRTAFDKTRVLLVPTRYVLVPTHLLLLNIACNEHRKSFPLLGDMYLLLRCWRLHRCLEGLPDVRAVIVRTLRARADVAIHYKNELLRHCPMIDIGARVGLEAACKTKVCTLLGSKHV